MSHSDVPPSRGRKGERDLLQELIDDGDADAELLAEMASAFQGSRPPPPELRARLLDEVGMGGRLHRFADDVARLLDVDVARARALLDGVDDRGVWEDSPLPDVRLYHVDGGERVRGAITGFVRIDAEGVFPDHEHAGDEAVLVVQGRCRDSRDGRVLGPGDIGRMRPVDGIHRVEALPGPPLIYLAVVFEGIAIGGQRFGPDTM